MALPTATRVPGAAPQGTNVGRTTKEMMKPGGRGEQNTKKMKKY